MDLSKFKAAPYHSSYFSCGSVNELSSCDVHNVAAH